MRQCLVCLEEVSRPNKIYCSPLCRQKAYRYRLMEKLKGDLKETVTQRIVGRQ